MRTLLWFQSLSCVFSFLTQDSGMKQQLEIFSKRSTVRIKRNLSSFSLGIIEEFRLNASLDISDGNFKQKDSNIIEFEEEIKQKTFRWIRDIDPEDEKFHSVFVSRKKTLISVIAQIWKKISEIIESQENSRKNGLRNGTKLFLLTFPNCNELKDLEVMKLIDHTLDFCSGSCVSFGKTIELQMYHPEICNSTGQFYCSPFPTFGLKLIPGPAVNNMRRDYNDQIRLALELLINSPAALKTSDLVESAEKRGYSGYPSSVPSAEYALRKTKNWISQLYNIRRVNNSKQMNSPFPYSASRQNVISPSLIHWITNFDFIYQFSISGSRSAEEILCDLWIAVKELSAKSSTLNDGVNDQTRSNSILFVAPRFHSFNAAAFENFVRTFSIALEKIPTYARIHIDGFHPEIATNDENVDKLCRSPYPTIHLIAIGKRRRRAVLD